MDWRDSNIVLGEQMNTRGYDASTLLPSHKGVGILRPDGDMDTGADVVAMTVRTYYMPNQEWREICARGRGLREAAGTLAGHAAGDDTTHTIDPASVAHAIGTGESSERDKVADDHPVALPEPLASVVDYLGDEIEEREFIPTSELVSALDVEPGSFAQQMRELSCEPTRDRVPADDGKVRQVRGYRTADIRTAVQEWSDRVDDGNGVDDREQPSQPSPSGVTS
jgi:S-DNA-T family DNA segregation ATPase FtsK/SpoIIIE